MTNNAHPIDTAIETLDRLRDLQVRPREIHVPTAEERWRADAEASDRAREEGRAELRQREAAADEAVELQAAEAQVEHEDQWNGWLTAALAVERDTVLAIVAEVIGKAVGEVRSEVEAKMTTLTRDLEVERAARRQDRVRALDRLKAVRQASAEKIAALTAKVDAQQRAIGLLEVRLHKTKTETARHAERDAELAVMVRAVFEELMLRR
jgi:hypothetical protein